MTEKSNTYQIPEHGMPHPAMKEAETVEQAALKHFTTDLTNTNEDNLFVMGAKFGAQWRKENPVKPAKEGKSAQSILSATGKTISTITHIELLQCMQEYAEAYHAAQFTEVKGGVSSPPPLAAPSTHSSSEMVSKYRQALSQIRRVEMLTPESEAMINKILNQ